MQFLVGRRRDRSREPIETKSCNHNLLKKSWQTTESMINYKCKKKGKVLKHGKNDYHRKNQRYRLRNSDRRGLQLPRWKSPQVRPQVQRRSQADKESGCEWGSEGWHCQCPRWRSDCYWRRQGCRNLRSEGFRSAQAVGWRRRSRQGQGRQGYHLQGCLKTIRPH